MPGSSTGLYGRLDARCGVRGDPAHERHTPLCLNVLGMLEVNPDPLALQVLPDFSRFRQPDPRK